MGVRRPADADHPDPPLHRSLIESEQPRWGLGDAAGGFLAGLFFSLVCISVWVGVSGSDEMTLGLFTAGIAGNWLGLGGAVALASRRKGSGSLAEDFGFRIEARDIAPGLAAGVLSQLVLLPLLYLPVHLFWDVDVSEKAKEVTDLANGGGIALIAACIVIGAPLVEELFFRGLLQRSVARRLGPRWAVAISAVAFGFVHFQPVQLLGLVAFGVVLSILAQRAGRLGPSLVAHMAFNATTVVVLIATR